MEFDRLMGLDNDELKEAHYKWVDSEIQINMLLWPDPGSKKF